MVRGLPKLKYTKDQQCRACIEGKQVKSNFKPKSHVSTTKPLELLHIDLFGPTKTLSLGGKKYGLVIVDDFSRYTLVFFFAHKDESFDYFKTFLERVQNEKGLNIISVRSDHEMNLRMSSLKIFLTIMALFSHV